MCVLIHRWRRLKAQMIEKRSKLGESQTLQQFSRDVDEIEAWISEKLQTATDESYKDPTNIQVQLHSTVTSLSSLNSIIMPNYLLNICIRVSMFSYNFIIPRTTGTVYDL